MYYRITESLLSFFVSFENRMQAKKGIVDQYFTARGFAGRESEILQSVAGSLGFEVRRELFRGKIYDDEKLMTLIVEGIYQAQHAVLKIFALDTGLADADAILAFAKQNQSHQVSMAQVLYQSPYDAATGYWYVVFEFVGDQKFFVRDYARREFLPSLSVCEEFCDLYMEYRFRALVEPLWVPSLESERVSQAFFERTKRWVEIAESKYPIPQSTYERYAAFLRITSEQPISMVFCHKHLDYSSIVRYQNRYFLFSPSYFGYAPDCYDTTFHIWAALKEVRDLNFDPHKMWEFVLFWLDLYKKRVPQLAADPDFEQKFFINMLERCIGALLLDIDNQSYTHEGLPLTEEQKVEIKSQLKAGFAFIFDMSVQRLG